MNTLATVVEKFSRGRQSLAAMTPANEGKKCLVPITSSVCVFFSSSCIFHDAFLSLFHRQLFVYATMENTDTVLVDVGAQHYVTKVCSPFFHFVVLLFNFFSIIFMFQTIDEARDYNTRRIKAVQENIAQLEQLVQKKRALRDGATYVIQQKIAQQTGSAH